MNVLFDTNVVLDLMLARRPFDADAVRLVAHVARGGMVAFLGATSVTTIHYIARRVLGDAQAAASVKRLLRLFTVAPVTHAVIADALELGFRDFEDAVLDSAATHAGLDAIVTRDPEGFATSKHRVFSPSDLLAALQIAKDIGAGR